MTSRLITAIVALGPLLSRSAASVLTPRQDSSEPSLTFNVTTPSGFALFTCPINTVCDKGSSVPKGYEIVITPEGGSNGVDATDAECRDYIERADGRKFGGQGWDSKHPLRFASPQVPIEVLPFVCYLRDPTEVLCLATDP